MSAVGWYAPMVQPKDNALASAAPAIPPERAAYDAAQELAKKRVRYLGGVVVWFFCFLFLWMTSGEFTTAATVALLWGIYLGFRGYHVLIAPDLERKLFEQDYRWRLERMSAEKRAAETNNLRSLEELSASIAHEIRNPITAARSLVQQMGEDPTSAENVEYAKIALEELGRVERSISHLLRYAREEAFEATEVALADVFDSALEAVKDRVEKAKVRVQRDHDGLGVLRGDPEKLRRIVINLVTNAIDAVEGAGTPDATVSVASGQNLAGNEVWLKVRDNGPGIPADRLDQIFSPFHTSKEHGTGLGLAIVKKLVDAHQGHIEVKSEVGLYTEFTVTLPRESKRSAA
ncbi:MAG: HAMP domain-containing sensor histidine kinase [Myxococcota bacterium]